MPAPRKYPDELRERAVREVRSTGRPVAPAPVRSFAGFLRQESTPSPR
ncbi:hypothetical protein [Streptomyces sp. NPDC057580]